MHVVHYPANWCFTGHRGRFPAPLRAQADSQAECKTEQDMYPKYEDSTEDEDFLPKRQPGSFPNIGSDRQVRSIQTLSSLIVNNGSITWIVEQPFTSQARCRKWELLYRKYHCPGDREGRRGGGWWTPPPPRKFLAKDIGPCKHFL